MSEPKDKPKPGQAPAPEKEGGVIQPAESPAAETGMVSEGDGAGARRPAEDERPGGMIGEG